MKDGQAAGEMLLDIETRIGELALREERTEPIHGRPGGGTHRAKEPLKHERFGLPQKRMKQSQAISRHPEIVQRVKAQARENEANERS